MTREPIAYVAAPLSAPTREGIEILKGPDYVAPDIRRAVWGDDG